MKKIPDFFSSPTLAVKVDVDTNIGLKENVPSIMRVFSKFNIRASFFVAMGPDNSGKALKRIFRKEFFKMTLRTRRIKKFPIKTLACGFIVKAPLIASSNKEVLKMIRAEGHECGIHGYDHVKWHEELSEMSEDEIRSELIKAKNIFEDLIGKSPSSCASPGWRATKTSLQTEDELNLNYHSDTRGNTPFFPKFGDNLIKTLEIPTTLPTLDEIYGFDGMKDKELPSFYLNKIKKTPFSVMTVHPELEGVEPGKRIFTEILTKLKENNINIISLGDAADIIKKRITDIPHCGIEEKFIRGRSSKVALQITG